MFHRGPPEILTPGTPSESQGTKFFDSKIFSYHKNKMLFNEDFGFIWLKMKFYAKNRSISAISYVMAKTAQNDLFLA